MCGKEGRESVSKREELRSSAGRRYRQLSAVIQITSQRETKTHRQCQTTCGKHGVCAATVQGVFSANVKPAIGHPFIGCFRYSLMIWGDLQSGRIAFACVGALRVPSLLSAFKSAPPLGVGLIFFASIGILCSKWVCRPHRGRSCLVRAA